MPQLFAYRPIFILFSSSDLLFLQRRADEEESSAISVEARELLGTQSSSWHPCLSSEEMGRLLTQM